MSTKAIICVDDERSILVGLQQQINQEFGDTFLLEFAQNGDEALEIVESLQQENIDIPLLFTDQMMPGMRGHELINHMHSISPTTKCILLSGYADNDILNDLKNSGFVRIIHKPWEKTEIIGLVNEICKN